MLKFSVVIPTYNRAQYVKCAIDSVLAQQERNLEIIVVDDGSSDDTRQVVQSYGESVCYIHQENRGVSSARNRGLRAAQGDWVAFLDSDDEWTSHYLSMQSDIINRHPEIAGSVLNSEELRPTERIDNFGERGLLPLFGTDSEIRVTEPFGVVIHNHISILNTCVFLRDAVFKSELFDESLTIAEDLDFVAKIARQGPFVLCRLMGCRIFRRKEEISHLSSQFHQSALRTRLSWARVYERFLRDRGLSSIERKVLRIRYAANQRALGNLYLQAGLVKSARNAYWSALELGLSRASMVRYVLSFVPLKIGGLFLRRQGGVMPGAELTACLESSGDGGPQAARILATNGGASLPNSEERVATVASAVIPPGGTGAFSGTASGKESLLVVMPTYNRCGVLSQTLSAIARTDWSGLDLEIVVIDNNSNDDTAQCVAGFQHQLPLILLRESRPGKNCALNKALQERPLRDLVVFVDDDITPQADWLRQIVERSRRWPDVSVFGSRVRVGWPQGKQPEWVVADWVKVLGFAWHDLGDQEKFYGQNATPMGPCLWVRKEVFSIVPRLDESIGPRPTNRIMGSEVSFLLDLERHGYRMVYCPAVQVEHRIEPQECSVLALGRRAFRYGRGEVRLYGLHRLSLRRKSRLRWNLTLVVDLLYHGFLKFGGSLLAPNREKRAEVLLNAMLRVGKIRESWRAVRGRVS